MIFEKKVFLLDYVLIGERIRKSRKEINMTQEEFAEAIGVSVGLSGVNKVSTCPS